MNRWRTTLAAACLLGALPAVEVALPQATSARIDGEILHANTLEVAGLAFRDVLARPVLADGTVAFTGIEAKAYGGRITGRYVIRYDGPKPVHDCRFEFTGVDLGVLVRSLGAANDQYGGRLDGWFELTIPIGDVAGLRGRGELTVSDGTLVRLPLLVTLLASDPTAAKGKDRLTARFRLRSQRVEILSARLESPAVQLAAEGRIGFDGSLDIQVAPRLPFSGLDKVPLLGPWMAKGLSSLTSRVARASVRGHVSQPQIEFWR